MEHEEILHRCFRCGYCKLPANYVDINCPAYLSYRFETYAPGGRMWLLRAWLDGKVAAGSRFAEILFSCANCGNCVEQCVFPKFKDRLLLVFAAGKEAFLDAGQAPPRVRDYLTRLQLHGNAYGKPAKKRADWAEGLNMEPYNGQEYLFFSGDVGAYDPRGQEIARSVARVLQKAGISFGILLDGEVGDGNDVLAMGERALFEDLAKKNIEHFSASGIKKIITLSPHGFYAFKTGYPTLGGGFAVFHYTQVLAFVMDRLTFHPNADKVCVTFHDPCYLGRHSLDYESPRMILRSIGVIPAEMDRSRKNALCCGGGGGNFFTDMLSDGDQTSARVRVREAAETGARVLAVACPLCAVMLEDAVKVENLSDRLRVSEISEIINERLA